ncbi:MAG: transglutaminase domain-containing protein [bacterium]|nr:transglutaminase domain-containing protein [bacterium]
MATISRYLHHFKRLLSLPFYLKKQTYVVRYQVMVRNTALKPNEMTIVVPVPNNYENQTVVSTSRFKPMAERVGTENRYGNQFAVWKAKFAPGESRFFTQHFTVSVSPIKKSIPKNALRSQHTNKAEVFCVATEHLQVHDTQIVALAKEAVGDATDVGTMLHRINELVMQRLEYGNQIDGLYSAVDAVRHVKVDCGGFDSLFAVLCIASGIPARIVSGFWAGYEKNEMHAWVEAQLPSGEWLSADPSTEYLMRHGRTHKFGKLGSVGSDRIAFSVGCDIPLELSKRITTIDILQHPYVEASEGDKSFMIETRVETNKE